MEAQTHKYEEALAANEKTMQEMRTAMSQAGEAVKLAMKQAQAAHKKDLSELTRQHNDEMRKQRKEHESAVADMKAVMTQAGEAVKVAMRASELKQAQMAAKLRKELGSR
jgi:ribosome-binding protein aMBF1 (putative translation factor)